MSNTATAHVPSDHLELARVDAWWRAANYLSVGQLYLRSNPLLERQLTLHDIKKRLVGHWGTVPGINFIYAHLNRLISRYDPNVLLVTGPGHGAAALSANAWLEGTYSEVYPLVSRDQVGMLHLFRQFSTPGGISSHASPDMPGSIHEGGELGYSLAHAFGAALDNPDLLVACIVGDGEAETGPLAAAWHSNKFLNPVTDGAVLPILHLNGHKIAGPTVLARIPRSELVKLLSGYGYRPLFVEGDQPEEMHQKMATQLERAYADIRDIQRDARIKNRPGRPAWPMIVLASPKGWTGPDSVDGHPVEGSFRAHQLPLTDLTHPGHLEILEAWLRSYQPGELFDQIGRPWNNWADLAPVGDRRMSANPHANGGALRKPLSIPNITRYEVPVLVPGGAVAEATRVQGALIRDVIARNAKDFRVFCPDETQSNRWGAVFDVTDRVLVAEQSDIDENVSTSGRVMEVLSEHLCQGWLEGYLITGRHGMFPCYESFVHVVDSMFNQHAKWLESARSVSWRQPIASLNYVLTSHVWRQEHNGFSHQDPGFLDVAANKSPDIVRIYLPPDANCLLSVTDHCLRSTNLINVVVAGKQQAPQWLSLEQAQVHCRDGLGIWEWACSDGNQAPDVVMACCGDVPTLETLAAVKLLRELAPTLRIRVVNVVDLMRLQHRDDHPHGLSDRDFHEIFTEDCPVIFAFHGYRSLVHRFIYRRANNQRFHVYGFCERGTTTTAFAMALLNRIDRFYLAAQAIAVSHISFVEADKLENALVADRADAEAYILEHAEDPPAIQNWSWPQR